jgi:hypothetical protein
MFVETQRIINENIVENLVNGEVLYKDSGLGGSYKYRFDREENGKFIFDNLSPWPGKVTYTKEEVLTKLYHLIPALEWDWAYHTLAKTLLTKSCIKYRTQMFEIGDKIRLDEHWATSDTIVDIIHENGYAFYYTKGEQKINFKEQSKFIKLDR